jgi:methyl-accepting chemotaxis protein
MLGFKHWTIGRKLATLVAVGVVGFIAFGLYTYQTLDIVKVNGPFYHRIVQGKDVIADVLPPPKYIIESYLLVLQMQDEIDTTNDRAKIDGLIQKGRQLRDEYDTRQAIWIRDLPEGRLKQLMIQGSHRPAIEFFDLRDRDFIPAVLAGDRERARAIQRNQLRPKYEEHRLAVDEIVQLATERNRTDEAEAAAVIQERTVSEIAMALVILALSIGLSLVIARAIVRPLKQTVRVIEAVAAGDVDQHIDYQSNDEVGALALACQKLLDYTRGVAQAADALSRGDLSSDIVVRSDMDVLSKNFVRAVAALRGVINETKLLTESARNGVLTQRGNAANLEGAYSELISGVNQTLDAIIAPVTEASEVLERMAGGDLTSRMEAEYRGDYARIAQALNTAAMNLDGGLTQVARSAEQVASAANSIAGGSQSLAQGASEQASALEEVASSLQEMTSMTRRNASSAKEARALAEGARVIAERGVDSMGRLSGAIDRIKGSANETAKIVKTIDEIAFQTNLLALNAAVEAARAGEAGKGFAVVAEEVRNLAMRSAGAARTTADLIEESVKNADSGVQLNQEVLHNLTEINAQVGKVREVTVEIATASDQQSQGIVQITAAVDQMNQVTQQNAANSEESAAAADELSGQAAGLRELVARYRLSDMGVAELRRAFTAPSLARFGPTPKPPVPNGRDVAARLIPLDDAADQDVLQSF